MADTSNNTTSIPSTEAFHHTSLFHFLRGKGQEGLTVKSISNHRATTFIRRFQGAMIPYAPPAHLITRPDGLRQAREMAVCDSKPNLHQGRRLFARPSRGCGIFDPASLLSSSLPQLTVSRFGTPVGDYCPDMGSGRGRTEILVDRTRVSSRTDGKRNRDDEIEGKMYEC